MWGEKSAGVLILPLCSRLEGYFEINQGYRLVVERDNWSEVPTCLCFQPNTDLVFLFLPLSRGIG